MKLYLSGIKSYQLDLGIECTAFSDTRLERILQGIKRDHREESRPERTPLTRPLLLHILSALDNQSYDNIVTRAAFTLAFAAFLRVGEFTYKETDIATRVQFRTSFMTKSSVQLNEYQGEGYLELTLPASKTDPFRHGIQLTIAATKDTACPVKAMRHLISIDTHRPPHAPLFCIGQQAQRPFTREHVVRTLRQLAIITGIGHGAWNGHSFRRGAATWAAEIGIDDNQIQTLGRWRSDAYKAYIEYSEDERITLSKRFQTTHGMA